MITHKVIQLGNGHTLTPHRDDSPTQHFYLLLYLHQSLQNLLEIASRESVIPDKRIHYIQLYYINLLKTTRDPFNVTNLLKSFI